MQTVLLITLPSQLINPMLGSYNKYQTTNTRCARYQNKSKGHWHVLMIENIFNSLQVYGGKWEKTDERAFTKEELAAVEKAEVTDSQYGLSVCMMLAGRPGQQSFIPLSNQCSKQLAVGDEIDLAEAKLISLSRPGETIYRVEI